MKYMIFFKLSFYKHVVFTTLILILCLSCMSNTVMQDKFPAYSSQIEDFNPKGFTARIAFPDPSSGKSRIWLKGSEDYTLAELYSGEKMKRKVNLLAPNYTHIEQCEEEETTVKFISGKDVAKTGVVKLYPKSKAWLDKENVPFSILVYGCFQPFEVMKEADGAAIATLPPSSSELGKNNLLMRELFKTVSGHGSIKYYLQKRQKDPISDNVIFPTGPEVLSPLTAAPRMIIGTGDQIYTDAAYEGFNGSDGEDHPISGWNFKRHPMPISKVKAIESFKVFLHKTYLNFYSFNALEYAHQKLPSLNVWDDHEIRDGWGSHGDEYKRENGQYKLASSLESYFRASREAYIAHQFLLGPSRPESSQSLHQIFEVGGKKGFAFDLRSHRNINEKKVVNEDQMQAFKAWCSQLHGNEEVIIVSSIPLFFDYSNTSKSLSELIYGISDDKNDSWNSKYNRCQRNEVVEELISLRKTRKARPIILSGDVHVGALSEIWYTPFDKKGKTIIDSAQVLCYQLIASGLSHETLSKKVGAFASTLMFKSQAERKGDLDFQIVTQNGKGYLIDPQIKKSPHELNFGAVEFNKDTTKIHLFFIEESEKKRKGKKGESVFWQNIMYTEWNKTWKEEQVWQTSTGGINYKPSPANEIHVLFEIK